MGGARPDVATAFGGSQFTNSGFYLPVRGLVPGDYLVAVYGAGPRHGPLRHRPDRQRADRLERAPRDRHAGRQQHRRSAVPRRRLGVRRRGRQRHRDRRAARVGGERHRQRASSSARRRGSAIAPDVGAAFGAQFTQSGYTITATMPSPGNWFVLVYARNASTGQFERGRRADHGALTSASRLMKGASCQGRPAGGPLRGGNSAGQAAAANAFSRRLAAIQRGSMWRASADVSTVRDAWMRRRSASASGSPRSAAHFARSAAPPRPSRA